ncbi:MAG: AAA family ATPase, partial [Spirochaetales bacterium]|nr:AAA family ATPase [Spirochaetales bacterium]
MKTKYPFGIQTFDEIIQRNYLYVDKTPYIYKMVSEGKYFFLSRPRRFGKSLTLSTIDAIFSGKKQLFTGTFMETAEWDWETYPVLRFDFSIFSESHEPEILEDSISSRIKTHAQNFNITLEKTRYDE